MKLLSLCGIRSAIALLASLAACASQPVVSRPLGTGVKRVPRESRRTCARSRRRGRFVLDSSFRIHSVGWVGRAQRSMS
ncbi:MAG: hypothetical protein HYV07_09435 [Deltaproteobacteria bacterium]|nr:hypothetical protein [Deltaproteobacteria bacterium]